MKAEFSGRIESLLAEMTLAEKVGQMTQPERAHITPDEVRQHHIGSVLSGGGSFPGENRLGDWVAMNDAYWAASMAGRLAIPLLYGVDAIHGHNNARGAVIFPHNIGLGAANDADLVERIGQVTAREVLATGVEWTFAPTLAVARDLRWGRTYESFSDDPEIAGRLGAALIRGLQADLGEYSVLACAKHWVGDGGTGLGVDQGETTLPEAELRAIHIAPYLPALASGVLTVMASYNSWNGEKCHGHRYLLTDLLKGELGFAGFVISDWDGVVQVAPSYEAAVAQSVNAGVDMFMVPQRWKRHIATLIDQVERGHVPLSRIDDAVRRILWVKLSYGLFDRPRPAQRLLSGDGDAFGTMAHRSVAREAVRKSLVLLKNEAQALPIAPQARILVAGRNADDRGHQCGGFTAAWQGTSGPDAIVGGTSIWEGIQQVAPGAVLSPDGAAADAGTGAFDVAVVVIGERPYAEGMGDIRSAQRVAAGSGGTPEPGPVALGSGSGLGGEGHAAAVPGPNVLRPYGPTAVLADNHPEDLATLQRIAAAGIPVIAILISGRPLIVDQELDASRAFIAAWLPGSEGQGVADVLFGQHDFQGRLPLPWPRQDTPLPQHVTDPAAARFVRGFGLTLRGV